MILGFHKWRARRETYPLCFHLPFLVSSKTCGPLWAQQCGSQYYTTGVCCDISPDFQHLASFAPAIQSKSWMCGRSEQCLALKWWNINKSTKPLCKSHFYIGIKLYLLIKCVSPIFSYVACPSFVDVVVVCDESNSIYPWEAVKNFLEKFVQGLDIGPRKTQVWVSAVHELVYGFLPEKIMLEMNS